jgi:glycosyltransferase involved in cell wall biosynthesis
MKLLYITNIPAPYRQKRFNTMARIFPDYGIDFEVLYMAKIEPNRKWKIEFESYTYPHRFFKGVHPTIGGFYAHFNIGLLMRLLVNDYDLAIVGGMASPTHWLAPFFIRKQKKQIMSVESNLYSVVRKKGFGAWMKKILLSKADAYQVTGTPQKDYIDFFCPNCINKPVILLPNLIDEDVFVRDVDQIRMQRDNLRSSFNVNAKTQMWVLPARLIEIKGILPFIKQLEGIENVKLFLLGDGEQQKVIEDIIKEKDLPVVIVGFVQQNDIIKYYAAADLFVLPSIKDPSPLTPIEAIASGLPLLVSSRIGNLKDVVIENKNGWFYDPVEEPDNGYNLVKKISALTNLELSELGSNSRQIYFDSFSTQKVIKSYATQLLKFTNC